MRKFRNSLIVSVYCGKTGIRTLGTRKGTTVFETVPIDHSGIFPRVLLRKGTKVFRHGEIFLVVSVTECAIFNDNCHFSQLNIYK